MRTRIPTICLLLAACGPQVDVPAGDGGATTSTTTADPSTTIANTGTATTVGTSVGTSDPPNPTSLTGLDTTTIDPDSGDSDPSSDSMTFIQDPEVSCGYCASCSVWDQDCPKGEKCMPWANDGTICSRPQPISTPGRSAARVARERDAKRPGENRRVAADARRRARAIRHRVRRARARPPADPRSTLRVSCGRASPRRSALRAPRGGCGAA